MQSALIISPFATTPTDAGHRRRTYQMTRVLADAGYRVTFLLYAFEDAWYWRHDDAAVAQMRKQWDEVIVAYAHRSVGQPPKDGKLHNLDEWWDPAFESLLVNLSSRRFFDLVVVHNVWLSKAFDCFPPSTVKVLETHDLFWKRKAVFERLGLPPEFFVPSEGSEIFGCRRADIAVTIQDSEGWELLERTQKPAVTVPFYDVELEPFARPPERTGYLSPNKVTFGVLASDNAFNIAGLNALLVELEREIGETFAPVEIVAAGRVGDRIVKRAGVKCIGFVETESQFFDTVDFAITPVFDGTGFKIKTADALALMTPTIFSAHAAEGCVIDASLVVAGPKEMARRMVEIALQRPSLARPSFQVGRARRALRKRVEEGGKALIATIEGLREYLAIDLSSLSPKKDLLALFSWMATLRLFSGRFTLLLILSPETKRIVGSRLPLAVFGLSVEEFRAWSRPAMTFLEVAAPIDRKTLGVRPDDLVLHDARWSSKASALDDTPSVLGEMPLLSTSVHWEASCLALRRGGKGRKAAEWRTPGKNTRFVYVDNPIGLDHIDISSKTSSFFIAVSNKALFEESIFAVLDGVVDEVVWSAKPTGFAHQMLIQAAACRGVGFHGGLDRAVVASGRLPGGLINEYEAAGKETLSKLRSELPGLRQERWERATSWDPTSAEPQASDRA